MDHRSSDPVRPRLSICAMRTRDLGAAFRPGRLLHHLRQHPRWHSGLPARRPAADDESSVPSAVSIVSASLKTVSFKRRRGEHLGAAPPADACSAVCCGCRFCWRVRARGGFWWVTRRLYGNLGGYTALALYCFSPAMLRPAWRPMPECWPPWACTAACTPASAWPTPCRGRGASGVRGLCCLTAAFGLAAAAHIAALPWWRCWGWSLCFGSPRVAGARCCLWCLLAVGRGSAAGVCLLRIFA